MGWRGNQRGGEENTPRLKLQTCQWFLLKRNFHTLCTSSLINLLRNFPCQAEVNPLAEAGEGSDVPPNASRFPASVRPWRLHFCARARVRWLSSLCHRARLQPSAPAEAQMLFGKKYKKKSCVSFEFQRSLCNGSIIKPLFWGSG